MQVLEYRRFVSEKLDITPMSKERLKKEANLLHIDNFWKGRKVCERLSFVINVRTQGFSQECWVNMDVAIAETEKRFVSWEKLPIAEQLKKHEQRVGKKMKKVKILATLYVALERYSKKEVYFGIIRKYADRVQEDLFCGDDLLLKLYYTKSGLFNN
jgi:hypothetical protein